MDRWYLSGVSNRLAHRTRPSFRSVARNGGSRRKSSPVAVGGTGISVPSYSVALHGGRYCPGAASCAWGAKKETERQNGRSAGRPRSHGHARRAAEPLRGSIVLPPAV